MKSPISEAFLHAINDAIAALQLRGHDEAAAQLEEIWEKEFANGVAAA